MKNKFRTAYQKRDRQSFNTVGETMTDQSQKDSTDINKILSTYDKTGVLTSVARFEPLYDDVSDVADYHTALNRVRDTQYVFDTLPSDIRQKFANDPAKFIEFMSNPENRQEAIDLGLIVPDGVDESTPIVTKDQPTVPTSTHVQQDVQSKDNNDSQEK